ncbi:MAG: hypothetical protein ACRCU3_10680 [Eubacteriaceae bacterium]
MISFDFNRCKSKKHYWYIVLAILATFLFNFIMEMVTNQFTAEWGLKLTNISQALTQIGILVLLPILSDTFSKDYQERNIVFFEQNKISGKKLYLSKIFVYDVVIFVSCFALMMLFQGGIFISSSDGALVIFLDIMIVLASGNMIIFCSMFFKKRWMCMMTVILLWLSAYFINLSNLKFISGFFLPVDATNNVAFYIASLGGKEVNYANYNPAIPIEIQVILCCVFWFALPILLGCLLAENRIKKNAF